MARCIKSRNSKRPRRQTSNRLSAIAARILGGGRYSLEEVYALAGSVLTQDEVKGRR